MSPYSYSMWKILYCTMSTRVVDNRKISSNINPTCFFLFEEYF